MSIRNQAIAALAATALTAVVPSAAEATDRVEPGLEKAVKWKWSVAGPGNSVWGLPDRSVPVVRTTPSEPTPPAAFQQQGPTHTVRRGDSLYRIARTHKLTVAQLQEFNGLESHLINIGDVIRIPTAADLPGLKSTPSAVKRAAAKPSASDTLRLRVFLDRQGFSTGPLGDGPSPILGRVLHIYKTGPGAALDDAAIAERARLEVPEPLTTYTLRESDFRFIAPPRATAVGAKGPGYAELVSADFLAYRTPWEFVAERFQADEAFLRKINPDLPLYPPADTAFLVPDTTPFEIENIPGGPVQPAPSADERIEAAVSGQAVLEIRRNDALIAALPMATARPGLRGRGYWRILDAITRPRMATIREPRFTPRQETSPFYVNPNPTPERRPATLPSPEYLPPGPNNPVGVVWINLTKDDDAGPLPFGFHGTSLPSKIHNTESIGGFQLSNRDAFRAATLLPPGTRVEWKP
jgi:LysM repeat protein/lipoprotein-anchoring transpeptidase ErfK/SrfK